MQGRPSPPLARWSAPAPASPLQWRHHRPTTLVGRLVGRSARVGACRALGQSISPVIEWSMTRCPASPVLHDQRRPARPDRAKADRWLPAPPTASSTVTGARDARRRRHCDLGSLAHSETAQVVRARILSRLAASVTYHTLRNASGTKTSPVRGLSKVTAPDFPPRKDRARACDRV